MYLGIIGVAKIGDGPGLSYAQINTTMSFNDGNWHHFTAVLPGTDATNYQIYVDETLQTTTIESNNFVGEMVNSIDLSIGTKSTTNLFYQGTIDELRIWKKALNAIEISSLSNSELLGNEIDLVAYYNFNQGIANGNNLTETTLNDITSNNSNGTLNNFTLNGTSSNWVGGANLTPVSVYNTIYHKSVLLFPNPSTNFIQISGLTKNEDYKVYNTLGTELNIGTISNSNQINIQNLTNGLYFLKLESGSTIKFIKE
jgi:hypothetical protein